jgi:hypothetical protein
MADADFIVVGALTRKAAATVRRPGLRMAPAINTNTCCHVGLVKLCGNGFIQPASLARPTPAIRPPNPVGERLDPIESAANPWCDHKGFNSHAWSENGQSRAQSRGHTDATDRVQSSTPGLPCRNRLSISRMIRRTLNGRHLNCTAAARSKAGRRATDR